jgi:glycyl-radical enzyme activating protein
MKTTAIQHPASREVYGMVFDIQPFSIYDGPGIRTTVFLKGCPWRCAWCHNPESWAPGVQIAYTPGLCVGCGACAAVCPQDAHRVQDGRHTFDRSRCVACGKCVEACPSLALELSGRSMTVAEVMAPVLADRQFFAETGGGLTVSGGEPLMQADFTVALLAAGRAAGIHTAVETSGAGRPQDVERIARLADLVLYDIKAAPGDFRRLTGADYDLAVAHLGLIKKAGCALWLRLPLVPGVNDTEPHFANSARLVNEIQPERVEIVPYHVLGVEKRRRFGMADAALLPVVSADERQIAIWKTRLLELGVEARVPGVAASPRQGALTPPRDVGFIATNDGTEQFYMEMLPLYFTQDRKCDLLVGLHGHGSDRRQFALDPRAECAAFREFAAQHGMIAVTPDYRAATSWMGPKAEADVVQIISEQKRKYRINRVFLVGGSMGGTSALTFAVLHPELVDGVTAMNALANHLEYHNFQEAIAASFGGTKDTIPEEYKKRSAEFWADKLTMPLAITVGGDDAIVPPDSVLRLAARLRKLNRRVLVINRPQGGHATNFDDAMSAMEFMLILGDDGSDFQTDAREIPIRQSAPGGLAPPEPKFGDSDAGGRRMLKMVKREEKTTGNTSREFMYDGSF